MTSHPAVAIVGGGPVGLAAALEAADRRWPFRLYEAGEAPAAAVRDWAHVRLFSPWSMNASARMRERLSRAGSAPPDGEGRPTGAELVEELLAPVAALPDVAAGLRTATRVAAVGRAGLLKHEAIGSGREGRPFRLLVEDAGGERVEEADVVLDCTGTWGHPNWTGAGGIPAPGERAAAARIVRRIPDFDREAGAWRGRRVLLVGAGHSAQTAADALARLAEDAGGPRVLWTVRAADPGWGAVEDDPLPGRAALVERARALAAGNAPGVEVRTGRSVRAMRADGEGVEVTLAGPHGDEERERVDRVVSLTGSVGDHDLYRQLQVHLCYATEGPMKLAAALLGDASGDCLRQPDHGVDALVSPEPDFFVLGSKSYGRNATFLLRAGYRQVEDVFAHLDRRARSAVGAGA